MPVRDFERDTVPLSECRNNSATIIQCAQHEHAAVFLTRRGKQPGRCRAGQNRAA